MSPNVILESKEVVDVVSVYKCAVDARDAMDIKAEMLEDGTGIVVSQPSVPSFLIKDVKQMYEYDKKEKFNESLMRDHLVTCHRQKEGASNPTSGIEVPPWHHLQHQAFQEQVQR